jgi:ParB family transcriptional regulator, chromosome partitioning protein
MQKEASRQLVPEAIGVKEVPTGGLRANPHNPRTLFDREPMTVLRESIEKVGILVPLTVYLASGQQKYTILDGQRRWMCAQQIGLQKVPVNQVAEPTLVQNIVTMFQIHKLREDWELMPTALKLEVLMKELDERNDRKLAQLTGLDPAVVVRCKKLLTYSPKYQDLMLDPNPERRLRADFFIELYPVLTDSVVKKMDWFSKDKVTQRMLVKYKNPDSDLKAVTDFRKIKQHLSNARRAHQEALISRRLREYTFNDSLSIDHLVIRSADVSASARKILNTIEKIEASLNRLVPSDYYGEERLWAALERLYRLIREKLRDADRRVAP